MLNLNELETQCWRCKGQGCVMDPEDKEPMACPRCKGKGVTLTLRGREFIDFLKRHITLPEQEQ
jgi:DnaJ-class molecular chaperone